MRSTIENSFGNTLEKVLKTIPVQYNGRSTGPGRLTRLTGEKPRNFGGLPRPIQLI